MFKKIYYEYVLKFYNKYRIQIKIGIFLLIILSYLLIAYQYENRINMISKQNEQIINQESVDLDEEDEKKYYYVDIKGAVGVPNVYQVEEGKRIIDVINMAGGLTANADTSVLNLSKIIGDEMSIIIYTTEEIKNFKEKGIVKEEVIKYIEKECKCPDPNINDACINNDNGGDDTSNQTKLSINNATKEQLMNLPGLGESKAQAIIDYRNTNGNFKVIEDIKNVSGIGDSIFDKIKDYITV